MTRYHAEMGSTAVLFQKRTVIDTDNTFYASTGTDGSTESPTLSTRNRDTHWVRISLLANDIWENSCQL